MHGFAVSVVHFVDSFTEGFKMFVHVTKGGVSYSIGHTRVPIIPDTSTVYGDYPYENFTPGSIRRVSTFNTLHVEDFRTTKANNLARMLANPTEPVWFMNLSMDAPLWPNSIFKGRLAENQAKLLPLLCTTYDCSEVEAEELVAQGIDHTPPEQAYASVSAFLVAVVGNVCASRYPASPLYWRYGSDTFAWLMGDIASRDVPHLQSLGFDFDTALRIDGGIAESWKTYAESLQAAMPLGEQLIENVNIAAKVALDSPQPVTIDVGPKDDAGNTSFVITFENVRLSPQVAGLRITLPTGGVVFLRDVGINTETGDIVRRKHDTLRRVSNRHIARRIVEQLARDSEALSSAMSCNSYAMPKSSEKFLNSQYEFLS